MANKIASAGCAQVAAYFSRWVLVLRFDARRFAAASPLHVAHAHGPRPRCRADTPQSWAPATQVTPENQRIMTPVADNAPASVDLAKKPSLDSPRSGPGRLCQTHLLSIFIAFLAAVGMGGGGAAALLFKSLLPPATALPPPTSPPPPPPPSLPPSPPALPSPPASPPFPPSPPSPPSDPATCYGTASSRTEQVLCTNNINNQFISEGRDVTWRPTLLACYDSCDPYNATQPGEDKIGCLTPGCRRATSDPAVQGRDEDLSCNDLYYVSGDPDSKHFGKVRQCMEEYLEFGILGNLSNDEKGRTRQCGGDFVVETDPDATKARCMEATGGEECVFQGSEKGGTIVDVATRTMYWETTSPDSGGSPSPAPPLAPPFACDRPPSPLRCPARVR